jgi:mono/diheme cytochrome c family protein
MKPPKFMISLVQRRSNGMADRLNINKSFYLIFLSVILLLTTGCDIVPLHMREQPRYEPLEASTFWPDGMASRPLPANTIPRGEWGEIKLNPVYYTGRISEDEFVPEAPIDVDRTLLLRGQERYEIFCAPCHGQSGDGNGMIVQRGFNAPPSFYDQRLVDEADGYFYDAITNGFGAMYGYGSRIHPDDRWAIVAYVRAMQYSRNVVLDELPAEDREAIESKLN